MPCQPCFSRVVFFFSHFSRETKQCSWSIVRVGVLLCGRAAQPEPQGDRGRRAGSGGRRDSSHLDTREPPVRPLALSPPVSHASASCVPKRHREELETQWLPVPPRPGRERWGGRRTTAPLHQQLRLPGQGRGRGAQQLPPGCSARRPSPAPWGSCALSLPRERRSCGQVTGCDRPASMCSHTAPLPLPGAASRRETTAIIHGQLPAASASLSWPGRADAVTPCATLCVGFPEAPPAREPPCPGPF